MRYKLDRWLLLFIGFLIVFIPSAIRYGVGADYFSYVNIYQNLEQYEWMESGLYYVNYLLSSIGAHFQWSFADLGGSTLDEYQMPAVQDWLASFANAKFVVTDSFHGMVFSIVFGKPFVVISNKDRGAARFESLLKKLNASDKLIDSTSVLMSGLVKINEIKSLDFRNLELEKEKSLFFLKDYL